MKNIIKLYSHIKLHENKKNICELTSVLELYSQNLFT